MKYSLRPMKSESIKGTGKIVCINSWRQSDQPSSDICIFSPPKYRYRLVRSPQTGGVISAKVHHDSDSRWWVKVLLPILSMEAYMSGGKHFLELCLGYHTLEGAEVYASLMNQIEYEDENKIEENRRYKLTFNGDLLKVVDTRCGNNFSNPNIALEPLILLPTESNKSNKIFLSFGDHLPAWEFIAGVNTMLRQNDKSLTWRSE